MVTEPLNPAGLRHRQRGAQPVVGTQRMQTVDGDIEWKQPVT